MQLKANFSVKHHKVLPLPIKRQEALSPPQKRLSLIFLSATDLTAVYLNSFCMNHAELLTHLDTMTR